ncbi:aldolase [Edaphobacter albus]|uniref:aldolase n=1 Tax=Edaphobacter sp. 4G125 TaxID=2763071 RepID=UPI0016479D17|nr:aldolase [Edaphobacter sp. 4G125]QNI37652.1 aldolase [Edaphobacter sp. 4G125]
MASKTVTVVEPEVPLRYTETFFPLGFPVQIETNRFKVLTIARNGWGMLTPRYSREPLRIALEIVDGFPGMLRDRPECRVVESSLEITFNQNNKVIVNLADGVAQGRLDSAILQNQASFQYYVLEAAVSSMISTMHAVALHAACVDWNGSGVMLCGDSGVGKTSLAYACSVAGWGYLSDDASYLLLNGSDRTVTGNSRQIRFRDAAIRLFPELAGREITPRAVGKPSIEIETNELGPIRCIESTTVQHILFLNRSSESDPGLYPIKRQHVLDYFAKYLLLPTEADSRARLALDRLINAQTYELRYQRLDWAVKQMRSLVEAGR